MRCQPIRYTPQLTGTQYESVNCGPCSAVMAIDHATCGKIRVSPGNFRARANPEQPELATLEVVRGLETFDNECKEVGFTPIVCERHYEGKFPDAIKALQEGAGVIWLIDYAVVNKRAPRLSGDPHFMGHHYVFSRGAHNGTRTFVFDPIEDGRRPNIPQGPLWWPLELMEDAAGGAADGWATFIIVYQSKTRPIVSTGSPAHGSRKELQ